MTINREPIQAAFDGLKEHVLAYQPQAAAVEIGEVCSAASGIVMVQGLYGAGYQELVHIHDEAGNSHPAMVVDLGPDILSVALLDDATGIGAGWEVRRTGRILGVPVGKALLGRVVNPLGLVLDGGQSIESSESMPVERPSAPIMDRAAVDTPLQTGILAIDTLIPIGRGQRELIIGDRQTGKSALAIDTILNQANKNCLAVYCAIGIPLSTVMGVVEDLRAGGALDYTVIVVASGNDTPGLNYIAPFSATTIGEYFMEQGRDVLVVYDDLTRHARSYRELALLLRRPPAREAFPGDIFYLHSRLLERATHLCKERGNGSLTALPIAETEAQNISAYIPTNLISITDGQIYLSSKLFVSGQLPAIDVMRSVSRVGGLAQLPAFRAASGELRLSYAQFEELEAFSRLDTSLDTATRETLERGKRVRAILSQPQLAPMQVHEQIILLIALNAGVFDSVPLGSIKEMKMRVVNSVSALMPQFRVSVETGNPISENDKKEIADAAKKAVTEGAGHAET